MSSVEQINQNIKWIYDKENKTYKDEFLARCEDNGMPTRDLYVLHVQLCVALLLSQASTMMPLWMNWMDPVLTRASFWYVLTLTFHEGSYVHI